MLKPIRAAASIAVNASQTAALEAILALDPVRIVAKRGLIPGVKSVDGQTGAWSAPGQTRRLLLTDGARAEETLIAIDSSGYRYRIDKFTGPFSHIVKEANARFEVAPRGEGSTLAWTYEFQPKGGLSAAILSFLVDSQWNAFMDAALERLKADIESA
jgi:carbon monoxide dehydrogenase subunit G